MKVDINDESEYSANLARGPLHLLSPHINFYFLQTHALIPMPLAPSVKVAEMRAVLRNQILDLIALFELRILC